MNNLVDKSSFSLTPDKQSEAITQLSSLRDLLRWGFSQFQQAQLFYGHGTDNAWDEIVYLILASLKLGSVLDPIWLDARLTKEERALVVDKIGQRINDRIPTAYLVHQSWFAGLPFYIDSRVLIPRSPTAELIEQQFSPWVDPDKVQSILDLGTGSGCIAIACAYAFPDAKVDAIDNSADALAVAAINVGQHNLGEQINLIQSDGFESLKGRCYDIIISNPPYVDAHDFAKLPAEYQHEPANALAAGSDGLDIVVQLLAQAKHYLQKGGVLIVEVGNSKAALIERFPHLPFVWLEFERGEAEVFLLTQEQLTDDKEI